MIFRNIILNALVAGLLAGALLSVLQLAGVSPIIFAAEAFEPPEDAPTIDVAVAAKMLAAVNTIPSVSATEHDNARHKHGHSETVAPELAAPAVEVMASGLTGAAEPVTAADGLNDHSHDAEAWAPAEGGERTFYTFVSNILAAIGFSSVLLALMVQTHTQGLARITPLKGLAWGAAGFIALFVVPAIGLPPEIPGMEAAAIENRQGWWLLAVSAAVAGLACLAFAPTKIKALGLAVMALPYLIGAPHPQGPAISHPDAQAVTDLSQLHADFVVASALTNLIFWLVLGLLSAYLLGRKLLTRDLPVERA